MNDSAITVLKSRPAWNGVRWHQGPLIRHVDDLGQIVRAMSLVSIANASIGRIIIEEAIDGTAFFELLITLPADFRGDIVLLSAAKRGFVSRYDEHGRRSLYFLDDARTIERYLDAHGLRDGHAKGELPPLEPLRVLVAEDERKHRDFLAGILGRAGCTPMTAEGGYEAVKIAQEQRPQILLLDGLLPEMHGFEVARFVRSIDPGYQPKIVLVTAVYKHSRYQTEARLRYGVDEYLVKPVSHDQIARVLFSSEV